MSQLTLTRDQSRKIDSLAIDDYGFSGLVLMENAGRGVVDVLLGIDPGLADKSSSRVTILCGKGNNAGDGFVIARHLEIRGVRSQVILLAPPTALTGDALTNYHILCHTDVSMVDLSAVHDLPAALDAEAGPADWFLDAMLGTGAQGQPREPFAAAIRWVNSQSARRLAVDVPSGLDCDTGQPESTTLRADHTCTFVAAKQGFALATALEFLGQLHVVSIGIPVGLISQIAADPGKRL